MKLAAKKTGVIELLSNNKLNHNRGRPDDLAVRVNFFFFKDTSPTERRRYVGV